MKNNKKSKIKTKMITTMSQKILNPQKLNKNRFHQLVKRMIGHSLQLKLHKLSRQYLIN